MKPSLLPCFFVFILLATSCNDDDMVLNSAMLYGTWEHSWHNPNMGLNTVDVYVFGENRSFERYLVYRDPESNEISGYGYYQSGTYALSGDNATFFIETVLLPQEEDFADLEDLAESEGGFERSVRLEFLEAGSKLLIDLGPCNDVIVAAMCIENSIYTRVE
ncbi:hypothetical protein [Negadavirga shengliensis]|uniref:Lipocalin-like domain-containing protein n=1 Tax=Negadavirga shengliensis TaxID=1389218 RepID=A0ABV9T7E3_9BACT